MHCIKKEYKYSQKFSIINNKLPWIQQSSSSDLFTPCPDSSFLHINLHCNSAKQKNFSKLTSYQFSERRKWNCCGISYSFCVYGDAKWVAERKVGCGTESGDSNPITLPTSLLLLWEIVFVCFHHPTTSAGGAPLLFHLRAFSEAECSPSGQHCWEQKFLRGDPQPVGWEALDKSLSLLSEQFLRLWTALRVSGEIELQSDNIN